MREILNSLNIEELEELGEILEIFMFSLHPVNTSNGWVMDYFAKFPSTRIFYWVNFIDTTINRPFPTINYRDRAHEFGDIIQTIFDKKGIGVTLQHPLFLYIATFYQLFEHYGLISFTYTDDSDKIQAFLRLDEYLETQITIDYRTKRIAITPGINRGLDMLEYIIESGVFTISNASVYTATLEELPEFIHAIEKVEIYLYESQNINRIPSTESISIEYH